MARKPKRPGSGHTSSHAPYSTSAIVTAAGDSVRGTKSLDDAAVTRIIAAAAGDGKVPKLDPNALRVDIEQAVMAYVDAIAESSRAEEANNIARLAETLLARLENPQAIKLHDELARDFNQGLLALNGEWPIGPDGQPSEPSFGMLKSALRMLRFLADAQATRAQGELARLRAQYKMSALMWLVGHDLANVFRRHLGKPGRSRRRGVAPYGPFVRFVAAVLKELGTAISPHTADAAIKRARLLQFDHFWDVAREASLPS
jgi:hypothetical protein